MHMSTGDYTTAEPAIVERPAAPYVGVRRSVPIGQLGVQLPPQIPVLFGWLGTHGVAPVNPPFWKYNVIDMEALLEVEVGIPVARPVPGDDEVFGGVLPAGRYVTVLHTGHPDTLIDATRELLDWAAKRDLAWDVTGTAGGQRWAARLEIYLTDPAVEPDLNKWETLLAFKLAD